MELTLTDPAKIRDRVAKARPLAGGPVPADIARRLGATHYDGKYFLTSEPYLVEGARKLHDLKLGAAKYWLDHWMVGYAFNSTWKYSTPAGKAPLDEIIRHPDYTTAIDLPFSTVFLEVGPLMRKGEDATTPGYDLAAHEREVHGVAKYLLEKWGGRDVTFILQNWEGDWIFRGHFEPAWPGEMHPAELARRADAMVTWFAARQRAVDRARAEFPHARAKVLHCVEVNKVLDTFRKGVPTLYSHVLPRVKVDLVSWSCYDGLADEVDLWHGIEMLRQVPQPDGHRPGVIVGEIGFPESGKTRDQVREWWDLRLGALLALDVPLIIHWELYCNEPKDGIGRHEAMVRPQEVMNGYWLYRNDGTQSWSCEVLTDLIARAGNRAGSATT